ncbi:MAG: hypothetical protein E6H70_07445 [Betaproteobacteria bacterium]|nr:MAG: hypothetical protein E6H70_07445 [Betaproteobacteria bacterium]
MAPDNSAVRTGSTLMLIAGLAFIGYAVVFFIRSFTGTGFELGVETLNGVTKEQLNALNPAVVYYINHLHIATAGFIAATGIAVAALSWWGVRKGEWWAWWAAMVSPVAGLAVALPMHYFGHFTYDWVSHLGPIYLATLVFVIGALQVLRGFLRKGGT